ncbi:MAG TPA: nucleotidyltransferase domain-containing protein [Ignavibacteria bacterium]|nr:nucleotidyltransferase domain-containing protein [Ignavibacteria bacterium]
MNNDFGISDKSYALMVESLQQFPEIEKVYIFGSRAMGNYKKGSDIDLAIVGENIDFETTSRLHGKLNEALPIPYFVDVVDFNTIENQALKKHILTEGKIIYEKGKNHCKSHQN